MSGIEQVRPLGDEFAPEVEDALDQGLTRPLGSSKTPTAFKISPDGLVTFLKRGEQGDGLIVPVGKLYRIEGVDASLHHHVHRAWTQTLDTPKLNKQSALRKRGREAALSAPLSLDSGSITESRLVVNGSADGWSQFESQPTTHADVPGAAPGLSQELHGPQRPAQSLQDIPCGRCGGPLDEDGWCLDCAHEGLAPQRVHEGSDADADQHSRQDEGDSLGEDAGGRTEWHAATASLPACSPRSRRSSEGLPLRAPGPARSPLPSGHDHGRTAYKRSSSDSSLVQAGHDSEDAAWSHLAVEPVPVGDEHVVPTGVDAKRAQAHLAEAEPGVGDHQALVVPVSGLDQIGHEIGEMVVPVVAQVALGSDRHQVDFVGAEVSGIDLHVAGAAEPSRWSEASHARVGAHVEGWVVEVDHASDHVAVPAAQNLNLGDPADAAAHDAGAWGGHSDHVLGAEGAAEGQLQERPEMQIGAGVLPLTRDALDGDDIEHAGVPGRRLAFPGLVAGIGHPRPLHQHPHQVGPEDRASDDQRMPHARLLSQATPLEATAHVGAKEEDADEQAAEPNQRGGEPGHSQHLADSSFAPPVSQTSWVYLDGEVAFDRYPWRAARSLAMRSHPEKADYIGNTIARNAIPNDIPCAVGELIQNRPQIWLSNTDRNAVWDSVMRSISGTNPGSDADNQHWQERTDNGTELTTAPVANSPGVVYPTTAHPASTGHFATRNPRVALYARVAGEPNGGDLHFQVGDRVELPHGGGFGTVIEVEEPTEEEDGTFTVWVRVRKDDGQVVVGADWMLRFVQGLESGVMPDTLPWGEDEQDFYRKSYVTLDEVRTLGKNYIEELAKKIMGECTDTEIPDEGRERNLELFRAYALLALTKGKDTTAEDVHDAWSAWRAGDDPEHKSLKPFDELTEKVKSYDEPYVRYIHKHSMADRTGHPQIDNLIEQFLQTPQGDWTTDTEPIEALRDPANAHGMCEMVTEQFVEFAKAHGFKAYVTQTDLDEMGYKPTGEPHGEVGFDENNEMQYGFYPEHTIATIVLDDPAHPYGHEFYIDFTATQYGYTDHPKVTSASVERVSRIDTRYIAESAYAALASVLGPTSHRTVTSASRHRTVSWPRIAGFYKWAADVEQLANAALQRLESRDDIRKIMEKYEQGGVRSLEGPEYEVWAFLAKQLTHTQETGALPAETYKMWEWLVGQLKRGNVSFARQGDHIRDIITQATTHMKWCQDYHQPVPDWKAKTFTFQNMQDWVYEMNARDLGEKDDEHWLGDSKIIYRFDDGYTMVELHPNDLAQEGQDMGHCVGGYGHEVSTGASYIVSLRDPKGNPHVTLEMEGTKPTPDQDTTWCVHQIMGKQDRKPIEEYREYIRQWFQSLKDEGLNVRWGESPYAPDGAIAEGDDYEPEYLPAENDYDIHSLEDVQGLADHLKNYGMGSFWEDDYDHEPIWQDGEDPDYEIEGKHQVAAIMNANRVSVHGNKDHDLDNLLDYWREFIRSILNGKLDDRDEIEQYVQGFYFVPKTDREANFFYGHPLLNDDQRMRWNKDENEKHALDVWEEAAHEEMSKQPPPKRVQPVKQPQLFDSADMITVPQPTLVKGRQLAQFALQYMAALYRGYEVMHKGERNHIHDTPEHLRTQYDKNYERVRETRPEGDTSPDWAQEGPYIIRPTEPGERVPSHREWAVPKAPGWGTGEIMPTVRTPHVEFKEYESPYDVDRYNPVEQAQPGTQWGMPNPRAPMWKDKRLEAPWQSYLPEMGERHQRIQEIDAELDGIRDKESPTYDPDWYRNERYNQLNNERAALMKAASYLPDTLRLGSAFATDGLRVEAGLSESQKREQILNMEARFGPDQSEAVHQFPSGHTIRRHNRRGDVARTGYLMHNCWAQADQGRRMDDDPACVGYRNHRYTLNEPSGFPVSAFFVDPVQDFGWTSKPTGETTHPAGSMTIHSALGHGNAPLRPEYEQMIHEWGDSHPHPVNYGYFKTQEQPHIQVLRDAITKTADYNGWTNWDTWNTALMMDNDEPLYRESRKLMEQGMTVQQLYAWCLEKIIGPHNRDAIKDAQEWNDIPEDERIDHQWEELRDRSPQAADLVDQFGFGKDVSDTTPTLIDPELVNWQEIWDGLHEEIEDNQESERHSDKAREEGIEFYQPGTDPTRPSNLMLDAWMKHHGIEHAEQRLPGGAHARYHTPFWVPMEHLLQGGSQYHWPNGFGQDHLEQIAAEGGYNDSVDAVGWKTLGDIQRSRPNPYIPLMRTALEGQGHTPQQIEQIMKPIWRLNPETDRYEEIEPAQPKVDPSLDQPGEMTLPDHWGSTKTAMPYSDNTWYHVTDRRKLPQIAEQGLVGSEQGTDRTWGDFPAEESAVYLWPTASMAQTYARGSNTPTRWSYPTILRVRGIDRNNLGLDHEALGDAMEGVSERARTEDAEDWEHELHNWYTQYLQHDPAPPKDYANFNSIQQQRQREFEHNIRALRAMPAHLREELARERSQMNGDAVMHYGPIHPNNIDVGKLNIYGDDGSTEDVQDRFHEEHPEWARGPEEDDDEDEWYGQHDQALDNWMGAQGRWVTPEDLDDWHEQALDDPEDDSNSHVYNWHPIGEHVQREFYSKTAMVDPHLWEVVMRALQHMNTAFRPGEVTQEALGDRIITEIMDAYPPGQRPSNEELQQAAEFAIQMWNGSQGEGTDGFNAQRYVQQHADPRLPVDGMEEQVEGWGEPYRNYWGDPRYPGMMRQNRTALALPATPPAIVQQAPAPQAQAPAGVNVPTMQQAVQPPQREDNGTPIPAIFGDTFKYPSYQKGVTSGSFSLTSAQVQSGHVAVWLGAVVGNGDDWIQAGIQQTVGATAPETYVEFGKGGFTTKYVKIGDYVLGTPVQMQLRQTKPNVWVIIVNGKQYGPMWLSPKPQTYAAAENWFSYTRHKPNQFQFSITPLKIGATITAMAERTGDPQLDKLIEEFTNHKMAWLDDDTLPVGVMRDPLEAGGMCGEVTTAFQAFVRDATNGTIHPENVEMTDGSFHSWNPSFEQMGYGDREPGEQGHLVSKIAMPSGTYLIDWTAAQYGYNEFPMVQRLDGEQWQREWGAQNGAQSAQEPRTGASSPEQAPAHFGAATEWDTKPENWGPMKIEQAESTPEFHMPMDVQDRFVAARECPECQGLLADRDGAGLSCTTCGWRPRPA